MQSCGLRGKPRAQQGRYCSESRPYVTLATKIRKTYKTHVKLVTKIRKTYKTHEIQKGKVSIRIFLVSIS